MVSAQQHAVARTEAVIDRPRNVLWRLGLPIMLAVIALLSGKAPAFAGEGSIILPPLGPNEKNILYVVLGSAIIGILYGLMLVKQILAMSPGSEAMQRVAAAIEEGALAYLGKQVRTMAVFVVVIAIGLFFLYKPLPGYGTSIAFGVSIAFLLGVCASYCAGYSGMLLAVRGNVRTANAALSSFKLALQVAFRSGTVAGMATVGLGLLGATIIFLIYQENAMKVLVGFGFGGALAALFMRIGGGIFTKAADVGADLVGKVEAGIPEDDPRNPATIADNVGDNVGDCAGMAADVFESYEVTLVAAIILGAAASGTVGPNNVMTLIMYPLLVRAVGVIASIIGTYLVRGKDDMDMDPMQPINQGFYISAFVAVLGFGAVANKMMNNIPGTTWLQFFGATLSGIILALVIGWLTEYATATTKSPVKEIAFSSNTGPATLILTGVASGLESSVWGVVAIALTIMSSMIIFHGNAVLSAYGIALSGLGLLTTTGYMLAMDTFGPISDNANGIFEMSGALKEAGTENAHRIVAKLDAVGNTTKALTKGLAIATAVLAATALFRSYMADADLLTTGIRLDFTPVFIGLLIGGAVPFSFCSFAINAVSRAAFQLVQEVRRQFRADPGIMAGTSTPDYARCVAISTAAAQKELMGPAILAVFTPILVGFGLGYTSPKDGAMALAGFLAGAIVSGQLLAVFLSNSGGAWDNAKKLIEEGAYGGKNSPAHHASVIGDTVGDPFKDTAGPALNPMIKVMNLVSILLAPLVIRDMDSGVRSIIVVVALAFLTFAFLFAKRGKLREDVDLGDAVEAVRVPVSH